MQPDKLTRRALLKQGSAALLAASALGETQTAQARPALRKVGYTEYRANLTGGRHANIVTMRACVVSENGSGRRVLGEALVREPNSWTQFAGWSPDGRLATLGRGWETPENAQWEEEHKTFRFNDQWLYDIYQVNIANGKAKNLTAIERVSHYNSGLFYWPNNSKHLGFQALIQGDSHPFRMDRDGKNKKDLTEGSREFAYGFGASPDGKQIAYHKSYQVWIADSDGANARHIQTGNPFNFVPLWSPDGEWLLFLSGEHYDCHPHIVRKDGTSLRKIADRQGYPGVIAFLDVFDYHGGSSDTPIWSKDGKWVYYTAKFGESVELMRTSLQGKPERLTHSAPNVRHYHPNLSPDGAKLLFGSDRSGTRQLYVMPAEGGEARAITQVAPGFGAMWAHWQPFAKEA